MNSKEKKALTLRYNRLLGSCFLTGVDFVSKTQSHS